MDLEKRIKDYKGQLQVTPREEQILEVIGKSKEVFYRHEQESLLNYREFLWTQFRIVQKKWWLLQGVLLVLAGMALTAMQEEFYMQRSLGVTGVLFVILIIPELWKNRSSSSMEIEAASYYSLRQVYAARMLLFGMVDVLLITVFCVVLKGSLQFTFTEVISQFLVPVAVTACICFGTLCNKYSVSETVSIVLCILWSALWWLITINEKIYTAISLPVWTALLGISVVFLAAAVYKTLNNCNQCWEVGFNAIKDN